MNDAFTMKELLEAGVHFGHQVRRWNPKMKKYIYAKRSGIHIIDLQKTVRMANQVYTIIRDMARQNKKFLFVCTKKQGNESVKDAAIRCGMPYMIKRWPGGLLTNSDSVRNSIKKLRRIDRMESDGSLDKLTKKERLNLLKQKEKIESLFGGIKDMEKIPDALIVIDTVREKIALVEAKKLDIPTFALLDTNSDPDLVTHKVPANDDAIRAIKLFVDKYAQAINEGIAESTGGELNHHVQVETLDEETQVLSAPAPEVEAPEVTVPEEKAEAPAAEVEAPEVAVPEEKAEAPAAEVEAPEVAVPEEKAEAPASEVEVESVENAPEAKVETPVTEVAVPEEKVETQEETKEQE